jgi:hypothetical protein
MKPNKKEKYHLDVSKNSLIFCEITDDKWAYVILKDPVSEITLKFRLDDFYYFIFKLKQSKNRYQNTAFYKRLEKKKSKRRVSK